MLQMARGLAQPYPIALSAKFHSHFGFYCTTESGRFCFHNFHSAYAAKKFLETIIADRDYEWTTVNGYEAIELDNGTLIRAEQKNDIKRALGHEYTDAEEAWEPNIPDIHYWLGFIGKRILASVEKAPDAPPPKEKKERRPVTPEEKKTKARAKVETGKYITISTICEELGQPPRVCRAILRAIKEPKPAHGWAWAPSDAERIKSKIKQRLK